MKTTKLDKVRKREILVATLDLFVKTVYDLTSVNDILKVLGIAIENILYCFTSKEEVLEEFILDIVNEGVRKVDKILEGPVSDGIDQGIILMI